MVIKPGSTDRFSPSGEDKAPKKDLRDYAPPDVPVRVRQGIVAIHRPTPTIGTVVPVHAPKENTGERGAFPL